MIDVVTAVLELLPWPALFVAVAVFAYLESAAMVGLVVPGESGVLIGAALAARAGGPLATLIVVTALAATAGDLTGHAIGRRWGPRVRAGRVGRWIGPGRWERSDRLLLERGGLAVFAGRFVPMAQAVVPMLAGSAGMTRRRFLPWSLAGAVSWSALYVTIGFVAGRSSDRLGTSIATLSIAAIAIVVLLSLVIARVLRATAIAAPRGTCASPRRAR